MKSVLFPAIVWRTWSTRLGVIAALLLGSVAFKPALITIASVPKIFMGAGSQPQATAAARNEQRQQQIRQIRAENFDLGQFPVNGKTEKHWRHILWTTAVVEPKEIFVATALDQILAMMTLSGLSSSQQRTIDMATKVGTQLYLSDPIFYKGIGQRFRAAVEQSQDPEWVAAALSALVKAGLAPDEVQLLVDRVKQRLSGWSKDPSLYTTVMDLAASGTASPPPLGDLLNWAIAPQQLHLYVLCRPDREVLCQAILKDPQGQFVRQANGQLWSVSLLLRSLHGLHWNFVRGQTPQGIYRIEGVVPQPDNEFFRAYGQFDLVNLYVPFEQGAKQFLPQKRGTFSGRIEAYRDLLPPSWRGYFPMEQSYWAGRIGRSLFRIHGTGEAPGFFSGQRKNPTTYNWNPTIGCLSALELYDERGQLVEADMPKLLDALRTVGGNHFAGYLMVLELPGNATPVSLTEIEAAIAQGQPASRRTTPTKTSRGYIQPISLKSARQSATQSGVLRLDALPPRKSEPQAHPSPDAQSPANPAPLPLAY